MQPNPLLISDAGHGGHDAGAINGVTGHKEKDIVLDFSRRFVKWLEHYTSEKVLQTRNQDVFLKLYERASMANNHGVPLISWHCNAFNNKAKGVEAFTSPGQTKSDPWATALLEAYVEENPQVARRFDLSDGDPDKEARFTVLTKTRKEAVLFELGFIDSPEDIKLLSDSEWRERNAKKLAHATAVHFGRLKKTDKSTQSPAKLLTTEQRLARLEKIHSLKPYA